MVDVERRYRILVVDDDEVDRTAVRRALRTARVSADFREADSVDAALAALREERFDCAFLDYQLPGGDGLRVLREARREGIQTPIVMLTGRDDGETVAELIKAGASEYLNKNRASAERVAQALHHAIRVFAAEELAREAERALRESEERFRVLHETSPDGFMIFRSIRNETGEIVDFEWVYTNPAGTRLSELSADEMVGNRLLDVRPGTRESGLFDLYREVVETGEPRQMEVYYGHEGLDVWFRITAAKLADGFAVNFTDVTRRRQAEEERERAIAARSRFYAAMSHELRTPINAVLGYTDLILAGAYGPLNDRQSVGIERTHRAAKHLLELVNDVLDLSKLEAGKLEIEVEEVSIPALVDDLFTTVRPLAADRGTELRLQAERCSRRLITDPRRVRQILLNLLSNAIKFGEGRPVSVRCEQDEEGWTSIEVIDQGIGIAPEHLSRIFEEFVQVGEERGGTGLGLPISKRLAELLGGRLEVESAPGEGSTFRLYLPSVTSTEPIGTIRE